MASRAVLSVVVAALVISVLNVEASSIINNISVSNGPFGIAIDTSSNKVYVTNRDSNTISVIDGRTNAVVDTIQVDRNPYGIAVHPETHKLYVANYGSGTLSLVDGSATEIIVTIPNAGAYDVVVNPTTEKVYVTNTDFDSVSVISSRTEKITDTIHVDSSPRGIAVNQDTNTIYVTNFDSNTVSVIDGSTDKVIDTIEVGRNPGAIVINSQTNMMYVANYGSNSVSVIGDTRKELTSVEDTKPTPVDNSAPIRVDAPERFYLDIEGERSYVEITSDAFVLDFKYEEEQRQISFTLEDDEESKTVLTIPRQFSDETPDVLTAGYISSPVITLEDDLWAITLNHETGSHNVVIEGSVKSVVSVEEPESDSSVTGKIESTVSSISDWITDFFNSILKFMGLSSVQR